MPLDPNDEQKVRDWLRAKCPQPAICAVCSHAALKIDEPIGVVIMPTPFPSTMNIAGAQIGKFVAVVCQHCANTQLFLAHPMGITVPTPTNP